MLKIIIGIIGTVVGFLMVWKSHKFLEMMGEQGWMVKVLGPNHGTEGYKFIGAVIIIISFLIMTGLIQGVLLWFFSPMLGGIS